MSIEKHLTNLELSKKLKAAGVPQKSEYYWVDDTKEPHIKGWSIVKDNWSDKEKISAYLSTEIGEWLPFGIKCLKKFSNHWECYTEDEQGYRKVSCQKKEVDTRAFMLIHLLDNNLIKAEDLK